MTINTLEQAEAAFTKAVIAPAKHDFVLLTEKTLTKDFGWVFFYTTRAYIETHDPSMLVPGVGPVAVTHNGDVVTLSTSVPPTASIATFETAWKNAHP